MFLQLFLLGCEGPVKNEIEYTEEGVFFEDNDGDGFLNGEDCNDEDASIYPGATEICDGIDNNCNNETDEGVLNLYYADSDQDGFGNADILTEACVAAEGYVETATDCDDNDDNSYPAADEICDSKDNNCNGEVDDGIGSLFYIDIDEDGYGGEETFEACDLQVGLSSLTGDCDDNDPNRSPSSAELCDDIDNNCNDEVDEGVSVEYYQDFDEDGFGNPNVVEKACEQPVGYVLNNIDCDDVDTFNHPSALERCDEDDNDCDSLIDEDAIDALIWYADTDGDGFGDAYLSTSACSQPFAHVENGEDCDDNNSLFHPNQTEVCDGEDNNCDGDVDEADAGDTQLWFLDNDGDGYGNINQFLLSCTAPEQYVSNGQDCDDVNAEIAPNVDEICDGEDNDCDGDIDEGDALDAELWFQDLDGDSFGDFGVFQVSCSQPENYVQSMNDCDDGRDTDFPNAIEYCDERDNDCDGEIDENNAIDVLTWYPDMDGDSYGTIGIGIQSCEQPEQYSSNAFDCDDADENSTSTDKDADCDDVLTDDDCDDNNSELMERSNDNDCDGVLTDTDCDDNDNSLLEQSSDNDCDGVINYEDCDDDNSELLERENDKDCDGVLTDADCDDNNILLLNQVNDSDCDGIVTEDDCDDGDGSSTVKEDDGDCDGVLTDADCDDSNPSLLNILGDRDCDGALSDLDCDDFDNTLLAEANDQDCDGVLTDDDCDDDDDTLLEQSSDQDCDGVFTDEDCDDDDSTLLEKSNDNDCDGILTENDCDDTDPASSQRINDVDCDGVVTEEDCDDNDSTLLAESDDADCDGALTEEDCDDNDNTLLDQSNDADCDGIFTEEDCDDGDGGLLEQSNDNDCDGIFTVDDCNDNDEYLLDRASDNDCDGVFAEFDCNDNDASLLERVNDVDCDGVVTNLDCNDNDSSLLEQSNDNDCDGVVTNLDCNDNDSSLLEQSNDNDCDGILTNDDCNDNDASSNPISNDYDCDGVVTNLDCNDNNSSLLAQSNDGDCDGSVNSEDAYPNDSSRWVPWTTCASLSNGHHHNGFYFLADTWGDSQLDTTKNGNFCADMQMNEIMGEVYNNSSGGLLISTGTISVSGNPFAINSGIHRLTNGTGTLGIISRSQYEAPYFTGTSCTQTNNTYLQGSHVCVADGSNYQLLYGYLNGNIYHPYYDMWMCQYNGTCGGPAGLVILIKARYQP